MWTEAREMAPQEKKVEKGGPSYKAGVYWGDKSHFSFLNMTKMFQKLQT